MAAVATIEVRVKVHDGQVDRTDVSKTVRFAIGAGTSGKHEQVSLSGSAFTALTVPTGAKAVIIVPASGAGALTIKGITGDTGSTVRPSSNPITDLPLILPLGTTPSIGILNSGSSTTVECYWL